MPLIPFGWLPGHWGLKGTTREKAKIEYEEIDPYVREFKLIELKYKELPKTNEYKIAESKEYLELYFNYGYYTEERYQYELVDLICDSDERKFEGFKLDLKYHHITEEQYQYKLLELIKDESEQQRAKLDLDLKYNHITEDEYKLKTIDLLPEEEKRTSTLQYLLEKGDITVIEYEKELATLNNEPYFHFDIDYIDGSIELETVYNDIFVAYLKKHGYNGETSEEIIDWYVRDCGRRLSADDDIEEIETGMSFIKSEKTDTGTSYT